MVLNNTQLMNYTTILGVIQAIGYFLIAHFLERIAFRLKKIEEKE